MNEGVEAVFARTSNPVNRHLVQSLGLDVIMDIKMTEP
jgi:hypothetical protein